MIGNTVPTEIKTRLLETVSQYFIYTMQSLLKCFSTDKALLEEKGFFIIRCVLYKDSVGYDVCKEL